jgi:hypothetical protein
MGRKPIFYAGQCHRRVVSAEHFVRCTFPPSRDVVVVPAKAAGIGGCGFTLHRANWHQLHSGAINDSHSCRFAPGSLAWGS